VGDGTGRCEKILRCRYHGWTYAFDGRLSSARDFGPAADFDPRNYSLFSLRCESWRGLVFVNLDTGASPLRDSVAPLEARLGVATLDGLRLAHGTRHELKCNWKTYVENYLEGYHIPLVHPALNAQVDSTRYEVEIEPPSVFHHAPARDGAPVTGLWAWLWPCLALNVYSGGVLVERMWPLAHDRMTIDYLFLARPDAKEETLHDAIAASLVTTEEDIAICETVQRNLAAGIYRAGRLSPKHEQGVAWFQETLQRALS
jgi:choline monooxygenase